MKRTYLFLVLFLCVFFTACQKTEENSDRPIIRIAYLPITHSIPILLQNELQKNNPDYKIELVKFTAWPELVDALRQNKVDGASILFEVCLKAMESTDGLQLVSLSHRDGNVVVSEKGISSFQDLKGKIVAIPHKLSPHNTLLYTLLEKESMSISDIRVVELAPADMPSSLVSGAISAFIVAEPYGSISVSSDTGQILYYAKDIHPDSICCAMVFHENFLLENPALTAAFLSDFDSATQAAEQKDDFVIKTYGSYMNLKENVIKESLQNISFQNLTLSKDEYTQITDSILRYQILDTIPAYEDFAYKP